MEEASDGAAAAGRDSDGRSRTWKVTILVGVMAVLWAATFGAGALRGMRKRLRGQREEEPRTKLAGGKGSTMDSIQPQAESNTGAQGGGSGGMQPRADAGVTGSAVESTLSTAGAAALAREQRAGRDS